MKYAIFLFIIFGFIVEANAIAQKKSNQQKNNISAVIISIPTSKCETCEETITAALKKVDGVLDAKVSADEKTATVQFTSSKTKLAVLEDAIVNAGYDANKKKRNDAAYKKLPKCCR